VHLFNFYVERVTLEFEVLCQYQPSIKMHAQVFHFVFRVAEARCQLHRRRGVSAYGEYNIRGFALIYFNSAINFPIVDLVEGDFDFQ
jgi:hypothetical protein